MFLSLSLSCILYLHVLCLYLGFNYVLLNKTTNAGLLLTAYYVTTPSTEMFDKKLAFNISDRNEKRYD